MHTHISHFVVLYFLSTGDLWSYSSTFKVLEMLLVYVPPCRGVKVCMWDLSPSLFLPCYICLMLWHMSVLLSLVIHVWQSAQCLLVIALSNASNEGFITNTDLDSRDANRKTSSCFLFSLIDEFKQPRNGTGDYTQSLERVITTNHCVRFTWIRQKHKKEQSEQNMETLKKRMNGYVYEMCVPLDRWWLCPPSYACSACQKLEIKHTPKQSHMSHLTIIPTWALTRKTEDIKSLTPVMKSSEMCLICSENRTEGRLSATL